MTPWGLIARLRAGYPSIAYSPIAMGCGPWAPGLTAARVLQVLLADACVAPLLPCCHCGLCDRLDGVQDGGSLPMPLLCPAQQALLRPPLPQADDMGASM